MLHQGVALVLGFIAGVVAIDIRDQAAQRGRTHFEACSHFDAARAAYLNQALVPWRDLSFGFASSIDRLRGPLNGLTIVRAEVDGPGFEDAGDVSLWAMPPGVPPGWLGGAILYSLNPVARQIDGRSTYPGNSLRQFRQDGEAVDDPRVIRAIAPIVAASCVKSRV